ncbi:MAG: glycosyltransferase [Candidatus Nealsonbacteria bacterium]
MKDVIVIPTYNERKNIGEMIRIISSLLPSAYILVVDDNSPDGTAREVEELKKENPHLELLLRSKKEGLKRAYFAAFEKLLLDKDVRSLCTFDADFSHNPRYLPEVLSQIDKFDVVVGSRHAQGGRAEGLPFYRKLESKIANFYFRTILRLPLRDCTSGFMCVKTALLRKVDLKKIDSLGFVFSMELKYFLWKKGASFKEIPIVLENRREGESKITLGIILEGIFAPWRLIFKNCIRKINSVLTVIKDAYKKRGIRYIIHYGPKVFYRTYLERNKKFFTFRSERYSYFHHPYNCTCLNERAVEIPIVWKVVKDCQNKKILEVGNVLSHYFPHQHDIVDKYEKSGDVINQDVVDFEPSEKYDLIVSISTLEHVGFDEELKDPQKIIYALKNLQNCLVPGGKIVVTLPLGYNPEMDDLLIKGRIPFAKQYFLKKISGGDEWKEVNQEEVRGIKYNTSGWSAQGLVIGTIGDIF